MTDHRIRRSRKQERDGARRYGGRVNSGSGNGEIFKSDVRTGDELIEFKTTEAKSYRLKFEDLATAWRNALLDDRRPVFGIEFTSTELPQGPRRHVVLPEDDYLAMREELSRSRAVPVNEDDDLW